MTRTRARDLADSAAAAQGRWGDARPLAAAGLVSAVAALTALVGRAAPALTAVGPQRLVGRRRLIGVGAPGGVAAIFDGGPDPDGTPAVLAALETLRWRATSFLLGCRVGRYPDVARLVVTAGHKVAIHGQQHRNDLLLAVHGQPHGNHLPRRPAALLRDVVGAAQLIQAAACARAALVSAPVRVPTAGSLLASRDAELTPVRWTAWARDWAPRTPAVRTARVVRYLRNGGTVLLHDSDYTSLPGSWYATARCRSLLAEHVRAHGWDVRTTSQHSAA